MSGVASAIGLTNATDPKENQHDLTSPEAKAAFDQSQYANKQDAYLQSQLDAAKARVATNVNPTGTQNDIGKIASMQYGGAQIDPAAQFNGAATQNYQGANTAQLGNAATSANQNIGSASLAGNVGINRQDEQFRNAQIGLQGQLQNQAAGGGPSLAAGQLKEATDRNIANQAALAASQGGRNAGTVQRGLAIGAAGANATAAEQSAQMRMQEQLNAQGQLAGLTSAGRSADIGVNTSQAGLAQQSNLANQAAINNQTLQQAQLNQNNQQFNAGNQNQFALQQGQFSQQANLANAANQLQNQQFQSQILQQAGLANQAAVNQRAQAQAGLLQQAGLAGSAAQTQGYLTNTQNTQQQNLANQQAQLQQQALNDAMQKYMTEAQLGVNTRSQEAGMAYQGLQTQQGMGEGQMAAQGNQASANRLGGFLAGAGGAVMGAAMGGGTPPAGGGDATSDETAKTNIHSGNSKISDYLSKIGSGLSSNKLADDGTSNPFKKSLGDATADAIKAATKPKTPAAAPAPAAPAEVPVPAEVPASDEEVKTNVKSGNDTLHNMMSAGGASPTGDMAIKGGGLDVMGSIANINKGVSNAVHNPGSSPMPVAVSDEKAKTHIHDADQRISEFLNNIKAHEYNYKDPEKPGRGEGTFLSPMAQEMEKSELGKQMVSEDQEGVKRVDYGHHLGTMTAALAYLNEKLNKLEGKGK